MGLGIVTEISGASQQERRPLMRVHLHRLCGETLMNGIIYLVGLVVVVIAILSFFGLR